MTGALSAWLITLITLKPSWLNTAGRVLVSYTLANPSQSDGLFSTVTFYNLPMIDNITMVKSKIFHGCVK